MTAKQTSFEAIGTKWEIQVNATMVDEQWSQLLHELHQRIDEFDKVYSRFRPDSLISSISKKAGSYEMPTDALPMINFYHQLYLATDGRVTPLIGQTMVEAGYDAAYSFEKKTMHAPPKWEDTITYTDNLLTVSKPALLDFGAAGKGYLVDILAELIETAGIGTYLINAGGDIRYYSQDGQTLEIGLENPLDSSEAVGITKLTNASLCASAGSKRKWDDVMHIIDPESLQSPTNIIATWVIADDTMTADGLATALFFADADTLMEQFSFSYSLLRDDMSLQSSGHFPIKTFEAK